MVEWLGPLVGLATKALERSTHKKRMEYGARLAELEIEYNMEFQKPLDQQDDGKLARLKIEITAIAKVAAHEANVVSASK